ncbi:MAG: YerC/YecD family TrpR-related protein [bacterium]|nr:YerC/YecD family TrpR-related protein [bacterium]
MPRSKPQRVPFKERQKLLSEFWKAVFLMETVEETRSFFKDLLSETEEVMLARRLKIAKLLLAGKSYETIGKTMHTGASTIASVHAWLDGGFGGYVKAIHKLEQEERRVRKAI